MCFIGHIADSKVGQTKLQLYIKPVAITYMYFTQEDGTDLLCFQSEKA